MTNGQKMKMQAYAHDKSDGSQLVKGLILGALAGIALIIIVLAAAYGFDVGHLRTDLRSIFHLVTGL